MTVTPVAPATYSPDVAAALVAGVITEALACRLAAIEGGITQYRAMVDQATAKLDQEESSPMGLFSKVPEEKAAQRRLDDAHHDGKSRTRAEAEKLSDDVWEARNRDRASRRR